ncbi:MAG: tetratricopeptide repeat protein, partial [Planctomycetota bacterium]
FSGIPEVLWEAFCLLSIDDLRSLCKTFTEKPRKSKEDNLRDILKKVSLDEALKELSMEMLKTIADYVGVPRRKSIVAQIEEIKKALNLPVSANQKLPENSEQVEEVNEVPKNEKNVNKANDPEIETKTQVNFQEKEVPEQNPKSFNSDTSIYLKTAKEKYDQGNYIGAIEEYTKILQFNPQNVAVYYNRGLMKYKTGDIEGSKSDFKKFLESTKTTRETNSNTQKAWTDVFNKFPDLKFLQAKQ